MDAADDFVEVELPDNEYFHEGVVGLAMDIVADCKMVVETVNGINTEMEPDTDAIKETFVQAVKRVPQSAARLVDMSHQYIRENAAFYLDDQQYLDLFKILQANTRAVKESVLLLLRLATVSVWTTKSAATTAKTQGQLETYCKNVAMAIKQVIGAADQLRLMQEQEEEGLIEEEAEELARLVMEKTVQLARAGSAAVKELVEATYQLQDNEFFVVAVKSTLQALTSFVDFGAALSLSEADTLRKAAFEFLTAAKAAFQTRGDDASFMRLESAKDRLAEAMRATVLAARAINTEDIVRNQLASTAEFGEETESDVPYSSAPTDLRGAATAIGGGGGGGGRGPSVTAPSSGSSSWTGARFPPSLGSPLLPPPAHAGSDGQRSALPSSPLQRPLQEGEAGPGLRHTTGGSPQQQQQQQQQLSQIQLLRQHLQLPPSEAQTVVKRATFRRKVPAKKSEEPLAVDTSRYMAEIRKIEFLQRYMRKWLRITKFRNVALNFLIAPESERLRKRNMALREIVCTERVYVNNLEELEKSIITPLKASSHSFISEKEVGILFSNLESITCLNIQILELMEDRIERWPQEGRFADIFIKKAPVLRLYTDYLNNYDRQVQLLTDLEKKPAFLQFIKACKAKMNLGNYLILPVQRLPRYEILLEGLKRYTSEEHVDYPNIIAALDKVKELNQHVDKKKKDEDNRRAIHEIQKAVSGPLPTLFVAHRQLIRCGFVDVLSGKKKERLYVYLFTDVVLLTKAKVKTLVPGAARPKSKLKELVYLKDGPFTASAVFAEGGAALKLTGGRREILMCFGAESERDSWQKDVDMVLREEGWKKIFY